MTNMTQNEPHSQENPGNMKNEPINTRGNTGKYTCQYCVYSTSYRFKKIEHELRCPKKTKSIEKTFRFCCNQCDLTFNRIDDLSAHIKGVHVKVKVYSCQHCEYKNFYKDLVMKHKLTCPKRLAKHDNLMTVENSPILLDEASKQRIKKYSCKICQRAYSKKSALNKHLRLIHKKKYKYFFCLHCDYKDIYESKVKLHVQKTHKNEKTKSPGGDIVLSISNDLSDKETSTKSSDENQSVSLGFDKSFEKMSDGGNQEKSITDNSGFQNESVASSNSESLDFSNASKLPNDENHLSQDFQCQKCSFKTHIRYNLKRHLRVTHDKIRRLRCFICNFKYDESTKIREHSLKMHGRMFKIKCAECDYSHQNVKKVFEHFKRSHHTTKDIENYCKTVIHMNDDLQMKTEICENVQMQVDTVVGNNLQASTVAKENFQMYNSLEVNTVVEKDTHMKEDLQMKTEINEIVQIQVDTTVGNNLQLNTVVEENDFVDKTLQENTVVQTVIHMNDDLQLKTEICENVQMQVDTVVGNNLQVHTVIEADTHMNDDLQTNTVVDGTIQMTDSLQVDKLVDKKTQLENMNTVVKKEALIKMENIKEDIIEFRSFLCDICDFKALSYDDIRKHCEIHVKSVGVDVDQLFSEIEF